MRSGLLSKRGIGGIVPAGAGSGAWMPGSRNGRGTPVTTPKKSPLDVDVALVSLTEPSVGATTVSDGTLARMPSMRSSWSNGPEGSGNVAVSGIGAGSGLPLDCSCTIGLPPSSVRGGCNRSEDGTNPTTVPCTRTRLPTAAEAGGAEEVKTKTPPEVGGSASTVASGSCTKKPLETRAVTMPSVVTRSPTIEDAAPDPWMV